MDLRDGRMVLLALAVFAACCLALLLGVLAITLHLARRLIVLRACLRFELDVERHNRLTGDKELLAWLRRFEDVLVDFQADRAANLRHNAECLETVMDMGRRTARAERSLLEALGADDSNITVSEERGGPGATTVVAGTGSSANSSPVVQTVVVRSAATATSRVTRATSHIASSASNVAPTSLGATNTALSSAEMPDDGFGGPALDLSLVSYALFSRLYFYEFSFFFRWRTRLGCIARARMFTIRRLILR